MTSYNPELDSASIATYKYLMRAFKPPEICAPSITQSEIDRGPIMIACTHRSHTDYFLIGSYVHHIGVTRLRFAAGDNLTEMPWLGRRFKSWGAFPVKRHSARNRAYIMGLCEDVAKMMLAGESIIVFPEGGRSYTGAMLELNQVVVGSAVLAQARNPTLPVRILPCAISYERLPELSAFQTLERGKKLRAPDNPLLSRLRGNLLYFGADIAAAIRFFLCNRLGMSPGGFHVDIGDLVNVTDITDPAKTRKADAPNEFFAYRESIRALANYLQGRFYSLYRLLPEHVMAHIIKTRGIDAAGFGGAVAETLDDQKLKGRNLRSLAPLAPQQIIDAGCAQLAAMKGLRRRKDGVSVTDPWVIEYYAASIT
jgi:1-acyl-sn-glycerol-3-phosphate acyltransferase